MSTTIEAADVGPIKILHHEIPDGFTGVLKVCGGHGTGKSTLLTCIRGTLGGDVRIYPRELLDVEGDVTTKTGKVTVGERTVTVGARTTKKGESGFESIEDRFNIEHLVTPRFDDEDARRDARIKALIGMRGAGEKVGIEPWQAVVGGKAALDALLVPKDQDTTDLVRFCSKLKSAIEKQARDQETRATSAEENARTAEAAAAGIDVTQPCDRDELQNALVTATNRATELKTQRDAYAEQARSAGEARAKLGEHKPSQSVEDAERKYAIARDEANDAKNRVEMLEKELATARNVSKAAEDKLAAANTVVAAVKKEHAALAGWKEQVESFDKLPKPDDAAIVLADTACENAREAVDAGAEVRMAKDKLASAKAYAAQAENYRAEATKFREQAAAVFAVLTQFLPPGPLRVEAGDLVMDTLDRKSEKFDKLSAGEKTQVAVDYVVQAIGDGGLGVLPQELWDGLNPPAKQRVQDQCVANGSILIVGEIAEGDLRFEPFAAAEKPAKKKAK